MTKYTGRFVYSRQILETLLPKIRVRIRATLVGEQCYRLNFFAPKSYVKWSLRDQHDTNIVISDRVTAELLCFSNIRPSFFAPCVLQDVKRSIGLGAEQLVPEETLFLYDPSEVTGLRSRVVIKLPAGSLLELPNDGKWQAPGCKMRNISSATGRRVNRPDAQSMRLGSLDNGALQASFTRLGLRLAEQIGPDCFRLGVHIQTPTPRKTYQFFNSAGVQAVPHVA